MLKETKFIAALKKSKQVMITASNSVVIKDGVGISGTTRWKHPSSNELAKILKVAQSTVSKNLKHVDGRWFIKTVEDKPAKPAKDKMRNSGGSRTYHCSCCGKVASSSSFKKVGGKTRANPICIECFEHRLACIEEGKEPTDRVEAYVDPFWANLMSFIEGAEESEEAQVEQDKEQVEEETKAVKDTEVAKPASSGSSFSSSSCSLIKVSHPCTLNKGRRLGSYKDIGCKPKAFRHDLSKSIKGYCRPKQVSKLLSLSLLLYSG